MSKITPQQRAIIEHGATGQCVRWVWQWVQNGQPVTRTVNGLLKRGLIEATYYRASASTTATEAGNKAINA